MLFGNSNYPGDGECRGCALRLGGVIGAGEGAVCAEAGVSGHISLAVLCHGVSDGNARYMSPLH